MKYDFHLSAAANSTDTLEADDIIAILSLSQTTLYFVFFLSLVIWVKLKLRPD